MTKFKSFFLYLFPYRYKYHSTKNKNEDINPMKPCDPHAHYRNKHNYQKLKVEKALC